MSNDHINGHHGLDQTFFPLKGRDRKFKAISVTVNRNRQSYGSNTLYKQYAPITEDYRDVKGFILG